MTSKQTLIIVCLALILATLAITITLLVMRFSASYQVPIPGGVWI